MPFKKITEGPNKGKYKSPSGRIMTYAQVQAYYAQNPKSKKLPPPVPPIPPPVPPQPPPEQPTSNNKPK